MQKTTRQPGVWLVYILIIALIIVNLYPVFNLTVNSFREHRIIIGNPILFNGLTTKNYPTAQMHADLIRGILNSILISCSTIVILVFLALLLSYAQTIIVNRVTKAVSSLITIGYFIPPTAIVLNSYLIIRNIGLIGTRIGLIIMYVAIYIPISFMLLSGFIKMIPASIKESATIDGAGHYRICFSIIAPLSSNMIVTLVILLFLWTYREYLWPIIFLSKPAQRPVAVALSMFTTDRQFDFGALSAAVVITIIPIMSLFIVLKEKIMAGVAAGAIKG